MRIRYLVMSWHRMSGVTRTILTQAGEMARAGHQVEVIGCVRETDRAPFTPTPGVRMDYLVDTRQAAMDDAPGELVPAGEAKAYVFTRRVEQATADYIAAARGGVLVTTRPALNLLAARYGHPSVILVGQDHMHLRHHRDDVRQQICRWYPRLDALVTLTAGDLADHARVLGKRPQLEVIPNAIRSDMLTGPRSALDLPIAVAAGRLNRQKGFDLLIRAWSRVATRYPDWTLRIYGDGPQRERLQALIDRRGLGEHVQLMGHTSDIGKALAEASLFVLSSRWEGHPLILVEAMATGLPAVAFDCPTGPADIIRSPQEGVLVPPEDVRELARAIRRLIARPGRRARLAAAGVRRASDFAPGRITPQWLRLYRRLRVQTAVRRCWAQVAYGTTTHHR